jgi:hypothetical protein
MWRPCPVCGSQSQVNPAWSGAENNGKPSASVYCTQLPVSGWLAFHCPGLAAIFSLTVSCCHCSVSGWDGQGDSIDWAGHTCKEHFCLLGGTSLRRKPRTEHRMWAPSPAGMASPFCVSSEQIFRCLLVPTLCVFRSPHGENINSKTLYTNPGWSHLAYCRWWNFNSTICTICLLRKCLVKNSR